jgi:hypothetical protein
MREPVLELPFIAELVREALALPDASLVIYRARTLIEFRTDRFSEGLSLYREGKHASWQIGAFDDHHCHLDVGAVSEVMFGAEPVSCQCGRVNYTVWFLIEDDCGNPYRPRAYFSVTLNRPYGADGAPRRDVIDPMLALGARYRGRTGVSLEPRFAEAMEDRRCWP